MGFWSCRVSYRQILMLITTMKITMYTPLASVMSSFNLSFTKNYKITIPACKKFTPKATLSITQLSWKSQVCWSKRAIKIRKGTFALFLPCFSEKNVSRLSVQILILRVTASTLKSPEIHAWLSHVATFMIDQCRA